MNALLCEACGRPATPERIARRLRRLELATRFRPIHIGMLFLAEAPPARLEDYFYFTGEDPSARSGLSRVLLDSLLEGVGIPAQGESSDVARLAEFQRRGFFLAGCQESPVEEIVPRLRERTTRANPLEFARRFGPAIVQRVQFSYKAKHIVLLSTRT